MGKSYIEYKGFGFWSRGTFIESWLFTLLAEMERTPDLEPWQHSLISEWRVQASIDAGCISLQLDDLISDKKRDFLVSAAKRALPRAEVLGRETGDLFIKLLEGRLSTTAASPVEEYLHWPDELHS